MPKMTDLDELERSLLEDFKQRLVQALGPCRVALFGSRARRESGIHSDMDVLVVIPRRDADAEDCVNDCAWAVGLPHGIVIVPAIFSRDEWEDGPERSSLLAQAVREEGIFF